MVGLEDVMPAHKHSFVKFYDFVADFLSETFSKGYSESLDAKKLVVVAVTRSQFFG
jgi:hypothetical protein